MTVLSAWLLLAKFITSSIASLRRLAAPYCAVCAVDRGDPICTGCLRDFLDPSCARCAVCAARLPAGLPVARCGRCVTAAPAFDATIVLGDYAPPLDGMVMALKAGGRLDLARVFAELLACRLRTPIDCLLAVPLGRRRQRARGFNQSLEIATVMARRLRVPLAGHLVVRTHCGPPQQSLPLHERRANVRGAFELCGSLPGRRVALVDDVMTSGATLEELARVVKSVGAVHVLNLVVARTE